MGPGTTHLHTRQKPLLLLAFGALLLTACGDDDLGPVDSGLDANMDVAEDTPVADAGLDTSDTGAEDTFDAGTDTGDAGVTACGPGPSCLDEHFIDLAFQEAVSTGEVTTTEASSGFITVADASAGGLSPTESHVYLRFSDDGAEVLELSDDEAFESTEWDLAIRRFVIRLNSGVAGPSCVEAGETEVGTDFDSVTSVPDDLTFESEAYFTSDCTLVADGSGIDSPNTVLSSFWIYAGCVQMTGAVYVLRLASGRHVKLRVDSYYAEAAQASCNETGSTGSGPSGSGTVTLRWAFLD